MPRLLGCRLSKKHPPHGSSSLAVAAVAAIGLLSLHPATVSSFLIVSSKHTVGERATTTTTTTTRRNSTIVVALQSSTRTSSSSENTPFSSSSSSSSSSPSTFSSYSSSLLDLGLMIPICDYQQVTIPTSLPGPPRQAISVEDLTPIIKEKLTKCGLQQGVVTVISRHTTTAVTINERESRLARDMANVFLKLVPPDDRSEIGNPDRNNNNASPKVRYQHNDIDQRPESEEEAQRCRDNGWDIDNNDRLQQWRDQEPINAHSHLIAMLLGSSESIPVVNGDMVIGQWQSVLLVDLDGPRDRTVGIQFMGYAKNPAADTNP